MRVRGKVVKRWWWWCERDVTMCVSVHANARCATHSEKRADDNALVPSPGLTKRQPYACVSGSKFLASSERRNQPTARRGKKFVGTPTSHRNPEDSIGFKLFPSLPHWKPLFWLEVHLFPGTCLPV